MKTRARYGTALVLAAALAAPLLGADEAEKKPDPRPIGAVTPAPEGEGWIDLLDGEHAGGWEVPGGTKGIFEIKDGVIHIFGKKPTKYVGYMPEEFGDFQLHVEFKVAPGTNSGIMFRADPASPPFKGFEIQVYDDHGQEPTRHSCGALYDVATPMFNMSNPTGQWNSVDMIMQGKRLQATMNGWKILDVDFSIMTKPVGKFDIPYNEQAMKGYLFVQDHGGEVWYRNIRVKKL
ncbi:MAG: DUF1080 domain-containing protein [Candidatus Hydrogenedentes bacterium]|nr:DUF1080 domain-containing protein [Candidatus Hydrogenedentota bacterium]